MFLNLYSLQGSNSKHYFLPWENSLINNSVLEINNIIVRREDHDEGSRRNWQKAPPFNTRGEVSDLSRRNNCQSQSRGNTREDIETPDANLSLGMRQLNGVNTQRSNKRCGRVGHVFWGRFKAILVQKEGYLLELCRYMVLNSVRWNSLLILKSGSGAVI